MSTHGEGFGTRDLGYLEGYQRQPIDIIEPIQDVCVQTLERNFEVGDLVFLSLQLYRQSTLKHKGDEKLTPRFYGPYRFIR